MKLYNLKIHPSAKSELKVAKDWYNENKDGLGKEFMDEIEKTIIRITQNPKQYRRIGKDVRKATLKRFPYSVVFSIIDNTIELYSFFHHSRNPNIWKKRVK